MSKNKKILIILILTIALLISAVVFLWRTEATISGRPTATETRPPSDDSPATEQEAANAGRSDSESDTETAQTTSQNSRKASPISTRAATTNPPRKLTNAPKQAEIIKSVTKEYPYRALQTPNDPSIADPQSNWQYAKTNTTPAWNITTGSSTIIAVIDTGFALQHEDLSTQWHVNTGESGSTQPGDRCWTGTEQEKATNSCDDDNNGYADDWRGWNFYGKYTPSASPCTTAGTYAANNNPQAGSTGDNIYYAEIKTCFGGSVGDPLGALSHGTQTAGLAGAATNNSKGIASPNWNARIMPLQALGDDGTGWTSDIVAAIYYAVDNGASIISMSLGGSSADTSLKNAIDYAYAHNVVIVAAAGNCGTGAEYGCETSSPGEMSYPALYDHVIAVGATDSTDNRASFSSYGPALDVVAPGSGAIASTTISRGTASPNDPTTFNYANSYTSQLYGTSFSTPIIAGIASLIRSVKPTTSVDDITAILDGTARKVPGMNGLFYTPQYGHGVINAEAMVTIAGSLSATTDTPRLAQTGDHRSEHSYNVSEPISSGCTVSANAYCTIRAHNTLTGADRYLPYALSNTSGAAGWSWSGATLQQGEWELRSIQGVNSSTSYYLFSK